MIEDDELRDAVRLLLAPAHDIVRALENLTAAVRLVAETEAARIDAAARRVSITEPEPLPTIQRAEACGDCGQPWNRHSRGGDCPESEEERHARRQ